MSSVLRTSIRSTSGAAIDGGTSVEAEGFLDAPVDTAVVCHPRQLIAAATAAILRRTGTVRTVGVVPTLTQVLVGAKGSMQVAVVFDSVQEDLADLFEALRHLRLDTPVVIVTERQTPEGIARAIELGAAGLVPATCSVSTLCGSVVAARRGLTTFALSQPHEVTEALQARRLQRYHARRLLAQLSKPELAVLAALSEGTSVTAIAARMDVTPRTVRSYVHRLGHKLDTRGQLRLAAAGRALLTASAPSSERASTGGWRVGA